MRLKEDVNVLGTLMVRERELQVLTSNDKESAKRTLLLLELGTKTLHYKIG